MALSSKTNYSTTIKANVLKNELYHAISQYVDYHREQMRLVALGCIQALMAEGYSIVDIVDLINKQKQEETIISRNTVYKTFPEIKGR